MSIEEKLLEQITKLGIAATDMKSASAERLAAIDFAGLPFDQIQSVELDWKKMDGELLPTLKIISKGDLP
jgi:hypothetical protein